MDTLLQDGVVESLTHYFSPEDSQLMEIIKNDTRKSVITFSSGLLVTSWVH